MVQKILRIEASARTDGSVSRSINDLVIKDLSDSGPVQVTLRDLGMPLPQIDADWVAANFTAPAERTDAQKTTLALSDTLVAEVQTADVIVIGLPVYNFSVPASLKAWIDLVARVGETFRYTETGPEGLLSGKRAIVSFASGGTPAGSEIDFATPYLRHVLGFLGITDVEIVTADLLETAA
ncbi:MAG: NAD(P)H-dependent oxidoreductase [Silicimonas sp.]|nr:NAD(P)H-dependent oxidoreductase [Silicimonas sp.]